MPIVQSGTLQQALWFSLIAIAIGLVIMRLRPPLRRNVFVSLLMTVVGISALAALAQVSVSTSQAVLATVLRETCLLLIALSVIRVAITFFVNVIMAKRAVPRILAEVAIVIAIVVFALVRMDAEGVNLTGILTTSAVLTGIIGFSLHSILGNMWGGVSLQLDNSYRIGDWIEVDKVIGEVVGVRLRYTALASVDNVTIIIPNQTLVTTRVTLLGRRGDERVPWRRGIDFEVGYEWTPGQVIQTVDAAFVGVATAGVAADPPPFCACTEFDAPAVKYVLYYWCSDIRDYATVDSAVRVHIFAALSRAGMEIPISRSDMFLHSANAIRNNAHSREQQSRLELLASLELFAALTDDERQTLAARLQPMPFAPDEAIIRQNDEAESLYVLSRGEVEVYNESADAPRQKLASVKAPAFVGEMGLLTGQRRRATVLAGSEVLSYRLDKRGFESILSARPEIIEALSHTVATREAANNATLTALSSEARAKATGTRANEIVQRIRQFFAL